MFGFGKKETAPDWLATVQETEQRWFTFLDKLEARMAELCEAAIPELQQMMATDDDQFKRTYLKVKAGINGQLENIRQKAYDAYDEKILSVYRNISDGVSAFSPYHDVISDFRDRCSDRYHQQFDQTYNTWWDKIAQTEQEDLEIKYNAILADYKATKNDFHCSQCGGNITIEKIYFITTHLACPHCNTQNTFEPCTQARSLEHIARSLAEQRTAHLLQAYNDELSRERDLYHQRHILHLSMIHDKIKDVITQKKQHEAELENKRQASIKSAPQLYEIYLREMFNEWNKIVPDIAEHNERFYQSQLKQFRATYQ